jgi:hypothetical protein
MSEANIDHNPQQPAPPQEPLLLNTRIEFLNNKYFFHETLKATNTNKHFIAEDLEHDVSTSPSGGFFYLKQSLYSHKGEYQFALRYYQKLATYCKMPFAKTDIIRLHQIHNFDIEEENYYEVVLIFDLGEPDRIDIDNIESQHINKFLKNVCLLLQDLKKYDEIYHGNIYIKNIVLVNTELKLSGFKPIYLDNPNYQTWKVELARKYGHFRSDLYLIGLIWLRFLGANVEEATKIELTLDQVIANIKAILDNLPEEKKMNIVLYLLDLANHSDITLDDVILEFDEFYILENIRNVEQEKKRLAETGALDAEEDPQQAFPFDDGRNSVDARFESLGGEGLRKSESKETNPFMQKYRESERDLHNLRPVDQLELNTSESKRSKDLLKIDGDFTLQDDDSIMPARLSKDELIAIHDVKRDQSKSLFENIGEKRYESGTMVNKINSEKRLGVDAFEEEKTSMRKLKSTEVLMSDSKKEIPNDDLRSSRVNTNEDSHLPQVTEEANEQQIHVTEQIPEAERKESKVSKQSQPSKTSDAKAPVRVSEVSKPAKKEVKVSAPTPTPKKISNFNKNVKKNKPAVYEIEEEKPSASKILREKRAELQGLKGEVELTSEQRMKIQRAVEKELQRKTEEEFEKQMKLRDDRERRAFEANLQSETLKEKIEKKTRQKVKTKKAEQINETKKQREQNEKVDQEFYQSYLKEIERKERHQKNRDVSQEKAKTFLHGNDAYSSTNREYITLPSLNQTDNLPIKKPQKSLFDVINKRAAKDFQISPFNHREVLFSYNRDLENKQVPFKKVTQNLEKYSKNELKKPAATLDNLFKTLDIDKLKDTVNEERLNKSDLKGKSKPGRNVEGAVAPPNENMRSSPSFANKPDHHRESQSPKIARKQSEKLNESQDKTKSPRENTPTNKKSKDHSSTSPDPSNNRTSKAKSEAKKNAFLDTLLNNNELKNLDPNILENKVYIKTIDEAKHLINSGHNEEAISLLLAAKDKFTNNKKIDVMKMIGALYQKLNKPADTKQVLLETLEYMLPNNSIENKEEIFKSIVINLVLIAIDHKDYKEAISLLKNDVFKDVNKLPNNYYGLLGDCQMNLGQHKNALGSFLKQQDIWLGKQISLELITPIFNLINKIILAYNALNDQVSIARYYSKMVGVLSNIKHVNHSLQLHENDFDNLLEHLTLNILTFANDRQNYNLMNYVLNEVVGKSLLNFVDNMNEEERVKLCDFFVIFCNYLKKLNNYGGFKANFIKYLDYAKEIIKNCDLNTKNLKTNLLIIFNRGIFHLQEQNYEKAQKLFDKCLEVYYAFFNEPDKDLYAILYSIGYNLYRQKKFSHSIYFFNKMLDLNCQDPLLKEKATKYLGKVYYRIGEFAKAQEILQPFIATHFEGKSVINYYRYLSIYYLALSKLKSEEFDAYMEKLQEEAGQSRNIEAIAYVAAFQGINNLMRNHHNYKENDKYLQMVVDLTHDKVSDKNSKSAKLVNLVNILHQKFVSEKGDNTGGDKNLIYSLRDKWQTIAENAEMAKDFLLNFLFMLLNKLPLYNERVKNHQFRQNVYDDAKTATDKQAINIYLGELLKTVSAQQTEEPDMESIVAKLQPNTPKSPANVFAANGEEREVRKVDSEQVLLKSTQARHDCLCGQEYRENLEIAELIEKFLKQIKNMLFLDVTENVEAYYVRFEATLKEKGITTDKYSYIKKLIQYHLIRKKYQKLDRLKFTKMLDELIEAGNLCVHDFKLIVVILESFKEIEYLHIFVVYLDTYHPNLAALIFQQVFLDTFENRYVKIVSELYKRVHSFRYYYLENFPLMHYLDSENFISLEKELQFKIFTRLRYDVMNEERMNKVFVKYIDVNDMHMFYVKYNTYVSIVSAIKEEKVSALSILRNFYNNLSVAVLKYQIEEIHGRYYVYDFLVLLNILKIDKNEDITETVFQILAFLEDRLPESLYYHFSVLCSAIGNLFFKHKLNTASLKVKTSALDLLNKAKDVDTEPPKYVIVEDPETHLMGILSFIIVNQIELKNVPQAKIFVDKIEQMTNEYAINELNKFLLKSIYLYHADLPKKSRKALGSAEDLFKRMNMRDIMKDMYRAAMDKIQFLVSAKIDHPEEVAQRARQSEGSIKHLYRPLI